MILKLEILFALSDCIDFKEKPFCFSTKKLKDEKIPENYDFE